MDSTDTAKLHQSYDSCHHQATAPKSQQTPTREGNFSSNHRKLDLANLKIPLVWANGPLSKSRERWQTIHPCIRILRCDNQKVDIGSNNTHNQQYCILHQQQATSLYPWTNFLDDLIKQIQTWWANQKEVLNCIDANKTPSNQSPREFVEVVVSVRVY